MADDKDPEWSLPHLNDTPCDNRAVAVLVGLKDGTFQPDIGRFCAKDGWSLQTWSGATVVAWANIPAFKDTTTVVDNDLPDPVSSLRVAWGSALAYDRPRVDPKAGDRVNAPGQAAED